MTVRNGVSSTTGTFDTIGSGVAVAGSAIFMGNIAPKVKNLSCKAVLLAETNTITLSTKWQVSNDNSTWVDVANGSQNAAAVVVGTGTAGADTAVTRVYPAPDAVYGWQWARMAVVVGVTTGAVGDTYTLSYNFRQLIAGDPG